MSHLSPAFSDVSLSPGRVAAKAAINAAAELGLTQRELARIIGVSEASVTRMRDGGFALEGKPLELALCLIRIFRSLDAICGGEGAVMQAWMRNGNTLLGGQPPRAMIATAPGLIEVMQYLDATRAPT